MKANNECLICKTTTLKPTYGDPKFVACPRCGIFSMTYKAEINWRNSHPDATQVANASGWVRDHQEIIISSDEIEFLLSIKSPSVAERASKVLIAMENTITSISNYVDIYVGNLSGYDDSPAKDGFIKNQLFWLGISYSANLEDLNYLLTNYLEKETGVLESINLGTLFKFQIKPKGYEFLASLKRTNVDSQIGFCAMWFNEGVLPIWTNAIEPAIKDAGYDPKRIDGHQHNNRIDDEIIAMLRRSKFVVADFTGQRGGVYFEAGFALGLGLQVIWTCKNTELKDVHFDNRQYNFVVWEEDKLDDFKVALQNRIEATIGRGNLS